MKNCFVFRACFNALSDYANYCKQSFNRQRQYENHAFSLVEMLMALLVASVLLAALAPVMTRKFTESVNISDNGLSGSGDISNMECFTSSDTTDFVTYSIKNAYYANFVIASGGGGGAGATSERKSAKLTQKIEGTTNGGSATDSLTKEIPITNAMTDVIITHLIGGGGGGGEARTNRKETKDTKTYTANAQNCKDYGNMGTASSTSRYSISDTTGNSGNNFAVYDVKNLCVTKFNQAVGTNGSTGCYNVYTNKCASNTNGTLEPDGTAYPHAYSGCGRWVCTHSAAVTACSNLASKTGDNWRLAQKGEMTKWYGTADKVYSRLGLCSSNSNMYTHKCTTTTSIVGGNSKAYPAYVWSGVASGSKHYRCRLSSGEWECVPSEDYHLFSTRCVLSSWTRNIITYSYYAYGGGGGGSASYIKDINITEYVKKAQSTGGGKIVLKAGKGGKGATSSTNSIVGANSEILVYDKDDNIIFGLRSSGGNRGSDASTTSYGSAGTRGSCYQYDTGTKNWISAACSANGSSGSSGSSNSGTNTSYLTVSGGRGGNSAYNNTGGGSGGNYSTGGTGGSYGAGGGGGGARSDSTGQTKYGGGSGSGGIAEISWYEKFPGAGGGGGGGGSVVHIKNVLVNNISSCNFVIGAGGKGGNVDRDGADGGNSSVVCSTKTFEVKGGKGGKKGIAAASISSDPTGGQAGAAGDADANIYTIDPSNRVIKKGTDGTDGNKNVGGRGGNSGTGTKGGCGGLYVETDMAKGICTVSNTDAKRAMGEGFTYQDIVQPTAGNVLSKTFGTAAAGGGAGAFDETLSAPSGKGGDGMGGYICVYLNKE